MKLSSLVSITMAAIALFLVASSDVAFGQTTHKVALRSVFGEPNLYITVSGTCGPHVGLHERTGSAENQVSEQQVFELIDLNGGTLKYGDEVHIRKCGNYLRVNSEKGVDSVPPLNPDGTPDSAAFFTIQPPEGSSDTGEVELLVLGAEVNNKRGFYVNTGDVSITSNVPGTPLNARSDFLGNKKISLSS